MSVLAHGFEPWTADDVHHLYDVLERDDFNRYEVLGGVLLVSPPPYQLHQRVAGEVHFRLRSAAPAGVSVLENVGVRLSADDYLVPDLTVFDEAMAAGSSDVPAAAALLVVEVESPSGLARDRVWKAAAYAQAGIPVYWRIERGDPGRPVLVVHTLRENVYEITSRIEVGTPVDVLRPFPVRIDPAAFVL